MSTTVTDARCSQHQVTFRDPQGCLHFDGDRVLRTIYPAHANAVLEWIRSPLAHRLVEEATLVPTQVLAEDQEHHLLLEHERIFFPSYPWEWTPGQWMHAAGLTLDLCERALDQGYILKDATPLNILFRGPKAVFVDVLSFERREAEQAQWLAYAQFVRTFLLPLAAYIHLGWPLSATQLRRDGYEPGDIAPWLSPMQRWSSPLRSIVTIPLLMQSRLAGEGSRLAAFRPRLSADAAAFALRSTVRTGRRLLASLRMPGQASRWSSYTETASHYASGDHRLKQQFVRDCLQELNSRRVLDVGANTGVYSRIAASCGATVVAWDSDVQAADTNWATALRQNLDILPVIADFARPTPALGWTNSEKDSLLTRAQGRFDCVLMLGVLHHLLLSDQIPLHAILDQLHSITTRCAIVEWIPQSDSQFAGLCKGRETLYAHLTESHFADELAKRFTVVRQQKLPNGRTLSLLEKCE